MFHIDHHAPKGLPGQPPLSAHGPSIHATATVRDVRFGPWTQVGPRSTVAESVMGDYSYVVNDSQIIYSDIGKFVNIAAQVRINPGNHPIHRASLHHFMYRAHGYDMGEDEAEFFAWRRERQVRIGHDVWIGHGAIVLAGRTIGTGAVVGAGAVVTKDVGPYTIVVGNPARPLRRRFDAATAERLQLLAWWDWSHEELKTRLNDFRSLPVEAFIERYSG